MTLPEVAARVRELSPGPETAALVLAWAKDNPGSLEAFLRGMLAALDPVGEHDRKLQAEAPPERPARPERPRMDREAALDFCRRLSLAPDGAVKVTWQGTHVGTFEDRDDDGEVWIFFKRRPPADIRARVKEGGFRYQGKPSYGWALKVAAAPAVERAA